MRICMALQAVLDLEMRLSLMAKDTCGYCIFPFRRVLRMAFEATDLCGVFAAGSGNCLELKPMTLGTILLLQRSLGQVSSKRVGADKHKENCQTAAFYYTCANILFPVGKNRFHGVL